MDIKSYKACYRFYHMQTANNSTKNHQAPAYVPGTKICYPQREIIPVWAWPMMYKMRMLYSIITMVLFSFRALF